MPYSGQPLLLRELARRQKRYRELLRFESAAEVIPAARAIGKRVVSEETESGIASPLTEQEYTGTTYYTLTSSDGLFVFEFSSTTPYLDANLASVTVVHRDPDA